MRAWAEAAVWVVALLCFTTCTVAREWGDTQVKIAQEKCK